MTKPLTTADLLEQASTMASLLAHSTTMATTMESTICAVIEQLESVLQDVIAAIAGTKDKLEVLETTKATLESAIGQLTQAKGS